jgi:hypothetical protein
VLVCDFELMKRIHTLLLGLAIAAAAHVAAQSRGLTLGAPGRANSTPWLAASGSDVAVAWGASSSGNGDIYVAMSRDAGRTFASPVRVNPSAGEARVSGEIAPRVSMSRGKDAQLIVSVTWNAKDGGSQIKTARSTDGGKTFGPAISLQAPGAAGDRGWQAAATDSKGKLHVIWLDHRGLASDGAHAMHKGEHDGVAMAQKSGLYYWGGAPERELFKGVCYCCKTALATGPHDEIYASWRHVFAGNMRDMAFTMSRDGGRTFSPLLRVAEDGWSIMGCPDDGPAMAVDANGAIHLVWPTVKNETGVILYATSRDGAAFSTPVRVPTLGSPRPSHPQIAIDASGRVVVAWDEVKDGARRAVFSTAIGSTFSTPQIIGDGTYPVVAAADGGVVAAWTSGVANQAMIKVKRLP